MSNQVNDEYREVVSSTITTIVQNISWIIDYIDKYELDVMLTEADKKWLKAIKPITKEYKSHARNME